MLLGHVRGVGPPYLLYLSVLFLDCYGQVPVIHVKDAAAAAAADDDAAADARGGGGRTTVYCTLTNVGPCFPGMNKHKPILN